MDIGVKSLMDDEAQYPGSFVVQGHLVSQMPKQDMRDVLKWRHKELMEAP
jgi:hypothetical protein